MQFGLGRVERSRRRLWPVATAGVFAVAALVAGCSSLDTSDPVASSILATTTTTTVVGPNLTHGALTGLKGTVPLTDLHDDFVSRLRQIDPNLGQNVAFAAESYDAVVIVALSAEQARSDAPGKIATHLAGITKAGTKCDDFASCAAVLDAGSDPDYDGHSGAIEMLDDGDPGEASYAVMQFAKDDSLQRLGFKTAQAADPATAPVLADPSFGPAADGVLTIGTLVPSTGAQAELSAPEAAGIRLAVDDVNAAGGVLGRPVKLIPGDSGDATTTTASTTVTGLLAQHVDAIIGPSSTEVADQVLPTVTGAGVILFSPAGTGQTSTSANDRGLFFRLAPSDDLQAKVLADVISQDGLVKVSVLAERNAFGQGLSAAFATAFAADGGTVVTTTNFDPTSTSGAALVTAALVKPADGVLILADDLPTAVLLKALAAAGHRPADLPTYVADINVDLAKQYAGLGG